MNITYVLLSPTFGMHQYTADLANRAAAGAFEPANVSTSQRSNVRLITTTTLPRDRYSPAVQVVTPVTTHGTGFSREGLDLAACRRVLAALTAEAPADQPDPTPHEHRTSAARRSPSAICHFTGVHLWNLPLVYALRRRGVPVIHTLHDLDPHHGVRFAGLIRLWNRLIIASGCHILVHGRRYRERLIAAGVPPARITCAPLLHGFLSAAYPWPPALQEAGDTGQGPGGNGGWDAWPFTVLFFGRVEAYKGVDLLLEAWKMLPENGPEKHSMMMEAAQAPGARRELRLLIAGPIAAGVSLPPLPPGVELRARLILDEEADALFRTADLLVLPYRDASQSALIAAAYAYGLPVIVTRAGALPEYVAEGETGWVAPPGDPSALAAALATAADAAARCAAQSNAGQPTTPRADTGGGFPGRAAVRGRFDTWRREEEAILTAMYTMCCRQYADRRTCIPGGRP